MIKKIRTKPTKKQALAQKRKKFGITKAKCEDQHFNLKKEIGLLLGAKAYIELELNNEAIDGINEAELEIAKKMISRITPSLQAYRSKVEDTAQVFHDIIMEVMPENEKVSPFCLGVQLLGKHNDLRGKKLPVGLSKQIIEMQDNIYNTLEDKMDKATLYADKIYEGLQKSSL